MYLLQQLVVHIDTQVFGCHSPKLVIHLCRPSMAKAASLPIQNRQQKLHCCRSRNRQRKLCCCRSRIGSGICVAADFCIGSRICVAADSESAAEICVAADPESAAKSASLPIQNRQRSHSFIPAIHPFGCH